MNYEAENHEHMPRNAKLVWHFIGAYQQEHDASPTQQQIREACALKEHRVDESLSFLEDFGYIARPGFLGRPRGQRSIDLLIVPDVHCCPQCKQAMRVELQKSCMADRPAFEIATCDNPHCVLWTVTLSRGDHEALTPSQIAGYVRARQGSRAVSNMASAS